MTKHQAKGPDWFDKEIPCPNGRSLQMYSAVELVRPIVETDPDGRAVTLPAGSEFLVLGVNRDSPGHVWVEADQVGLPQNLVISVAVSDIKSIYDR